MVVIPFPFSDLSQAKRRPALVIATLEGNDIILCQITSKNVKDVYGIPVDDTDFISGKLTQHGNIRPNRIFTADKNIILYKIGTVSEKKIHQVIDKLISIFTGS